MADLQTRPLRADAERNRRLVLEAAAQAFAEEGFGVGVAEIARRAGVGNATVFRRFPTKEALYQAIVEEKVAECVAAAELAAAREDPWAGLVGFLDAMAAMQSRDRGFYQATQEHLQRAPYLAECHRPILAAVDPLVARAQAAGVLRDDVTTTDVLGLMKGAVAAVRDAPGLPDDAWRRLLAIMLDGLRPAAATTLEVAPISFDEIQRSMTDAAAS